MRREFPRRRPDHRSKKRSDLLRGDAWTTGSSCTCSDKRRSAAVQHTSWTTRCRRFHSFDGGATCTRASRAYSERCNESPKWPHDLSADGSPKTLDDHTQQFCCVPLSVILELLRCDRSTRDRYTPHSGAYCMNTINSSVRKTWAVSLIALGLTVTSLTQADTSRQLAWPRNTIPQVDRTARVDMTDATMAALRRFGPRNTIPPKQAQTMLAPLQATADDRQVCKASRIAHFGHPGKGIDRIETVNVPCGRSRYAERQTRG